MTELQPQALQSGVVQQQRTVELVLELVLPPERKPGRIVGEGPEAVPALIQALRTEAKVL